MASKTDFKSANVSGMSMDQLSDIISQMKELVEQNEQQARQILVENPVLTRALFKAQAMLGMFQLPLSVPNSTAFAAQQPLQSVQPVEEPNLGQSYQTASSSLAPSLAKKQQPPPISGSHSQLQSFMTQPPMPTNTIQLQQPMQTSGLPHLPFQLPQPRPQQSVPAFSHQHHSLMGGIPHSGAPQMHHHLQPSSVMPPPSMRPSFRQASLPSQSPYQIGNSSVVGEFGTQMGGGAPPLATSAQMGSSPIISEVEKGLMQQIMNLTPEQLNLVPPEQKDQLLQLQKMLLSRQ